MGSSIVTGVIYAPWNKMVGRGPTEDELNRSADCLREVGRFARDHGVKLGVEAVNRYETYLVNTAEQALKFVNLIAQPNVGIHLDTFHMGIEEKSVAAAVRTAGDKLFHLHVIENDRGTPGTGQVAWDSLFAALADIKYGAFAGLETFLVPEPPLANLTHIWRKLAPDGDTLVRQGLAFLRDKAKKYGLAEN
jgi:D-psicose/D-tagatose/L-ribulose 3-epimerase